MLYIYVHTYRRHRVEASFSFFRRLAIYAFTPTHVLICERVLIDIESFNYNTSTARVR